MVEMLDLARVLPTVLDSLGRQSDLENGGRLRGSLHCECHPVEGVDDRNARVERPLPPSICEFLHLRERHSLQDHLTVTARLIVNLLSAASDLPASSDDLARRDEELRVLMDAFRLLTGFWTPKCHSGTIFSNFLF